MLLSCDARKTQNHLVCKRTLNHLAKLAKFTREANKVALSVNNEKRI